MAIRAVSAPALVTLYVILYGFLRSVVSIPLISRLYMMSLLLPVAATIATIVAWKLVAEVARDRPLKSRRRADLAHGLVAVMLPITWLLGFLLSFIGAGPA